MHVPQLLNPLASAPHIEVIEAPLPDVLGFRPEQCSLASLPVFSSPAQHPPGKALLDGLHHLRGIAFLRFADQQVYVVRHDYISYDDEPISLPDILQHAHKQVAPGTTS